MSILTGDEMNQTTKEEALEKLRVASYATKGKCNNDTAFQIALRKDSTVDDVIRLGAYNKVEPSVYCRPLRGAERIRRKSVERRIDDGRRVRLKDTVVWRYLQSKGLDTIAKDKYNLDEATTDFFRPSHSGYRNDRCRQLDMLMTFARASAGDEITSRPNLMETILKVLHEDIPEHRKGMPAFEDFYKGRSEFFQEELDWLAHAPQEILERFDKGQPTQYASMTQCMWNMGGSINNGNENDMTGFKAREYARQMTQFMKYMGIGVAGIGGYSYGMVRNRKNTQALAKYMMTVKNKFDQMIKKGFEVSIVREEVVSMLNNWVATKCIIGWTFYIRTDAPSEYPDLKDQQKIHKLHHSGSVSPTVVTVDDSEAKVVKLADGTEIKFNRKVAK